MLMPSIFGENLFDNFFDYSFRSQAANAGGLMKTDIKESKDGFEVIRYQRYRQRI